MRLLAIVALCLTGCGGGSNDAKTQLTAATPSSDLFVVSGSPPAQVTGNSGWQPTVNPAPVKNAADVRPVALAPAGSEDPVFTVEDEAGSRAETFELEPVHGKGFPELKVTVTARAIGQASPARPVAPSCREANRCQYPLGRKYAISLSDDTLLQMVPRGEGIAVVARTMKVDSPQAVDLLISLDNQVFSQKRIVLMTE